MYKYKEIKDEFGWTDEEIVTFCPDMKHVVGAKRRRQKDDSDSNSD
jgi:hypothetical protein